MSYTGNITIYEASFLYITGHIVFELNNTGERFTIHYNSSEGLKLRRGDSEDLQDIDETGVLDLISDGDWSWSDFLACWQGFAAGYERGKLERE